MTQICIFPIPDCVTFPGTVFPLHVFEPRYRQMIESCLETGMPVAICHTEKQISPGKEGLPLEEALQVNQATYKPYPVFSAGVCTLRDRMNDGRLLVDVHINQRYRLGKLVQHLPFQVYECESFDDQALSPEQAKAADELVDKVRHRLLAMVQGNSTAAAKLTEILNSDEWLEKSSKDFSFELFGLIRFNADLLQDILEMDSALDRLNTTLKLMNE